MALLCLAQQQAPVHVAEAKVPVPSEPVGPIVPQPPSVPADPVPSPGPVPPGNPSPPSIPEPDPDRTVPIEPPGMPQTI
jgi:hypothetical protein